ncbi:MFS transporter [Deinococcus deserti]|uniref:Putative Major Facilitator Superfamily protein n=1 Tax=Deinococcus deserti (strain DSM 17065 / CIP 109153 / LMG 22923 / VCD115) TaxID=546414 RepID=C1CYW6_DEIDV|nr:MFS transporter [Deinococcus deserti]ACO47146.1 putative Major Facilitator Superfamily protein [Deinococcus deserti VCD115]
MTVAPPAMPFRPSGAQLGLIAANFLMWGGFFAVIPLVTVHFVEGLAWTAASVGLILGLRQLTQQGLTVFGGAWADRIGPKPLILAGCVLRTLGFAGMAYSETFATLLLAALLAGVGGGLFDAPKNAAITAVTRPEHRTRMYSLASMSGNLGMVSGPLLGAALLPVGFRTAGLVAASAYLVALVVLALTLPHVRPESPRAGGLGGLATAAQDVRFRRFTLVLIGYFLLSTQINVAVTLKAIALAGTTATAPLYGLSAGLSVVLQYPLLRLVERYVPTRIALVLAVLMVATALGLMAFAQTFPALLACVALYSLGTMIVYPTQQALTARLAPPELLGSYFGFSAISLGVGGAVGSLLGGALVDMGARLSFPALPWLTLFAVGLLTALGLKWALREVPSRHAPQPEVSAL